MDDLNYPLVRDALTEAIEEASDRDPNFRVEAGLVIMAFSIATAVNQGERDTDRLVEIALTAIDETAVH
jgi:hypothetical protein